MLMGVWSFTKQDVWLVSARVLVRVSRLKKNATFDREGRTYRREGVTTEASAFLGNSGAVAVEAHIFVPGSIVEFGCLTVGPG